VRLLLAVDVDLEIGGVLRQLFEICAVMEPGGSDAFIAPERINLRSGEVPKRCTR